MSGDTTGQGVLGASTAVAGAAGLGFLSNYSIFKCILFGLILAALILLAIRLYRLYLEKRNAVK
jgi:hypothetical protein